LILGAALFISRQPFPRAGRQSGGALTASPEPDLARTQTRQPALPALSPTLRPASPTTPAKTLNAPSAGSYAVVYELIFMAEKDDSLFVMFQGPGEFPLQYLELKGENGTISGDEWGVKYLRAGECVTAWKDEGKAKAPKEARCTQVGERLTRDGPERLWKESFDIYYEEVFIEECKAEKEGCVVSIYPNP
jgi:hypothetical protein